MVSFEIRAVSTNSYNDNLLCWSPNVLLVELTYEHGFLSLCSCALNYPNNENNI